MFFGERKTGCRFYEFFFRGFRCLLVENNAIRVIFLLDQGADIISFVDKKTDTEFVWTNPMGISCLDKIRLSKMDHDCLSDNYIGGWFEILPNVGNACTLLEKHFSTHAEAAHIPWDYQVCEDSEEKIRLMFITRLSKFPIEVRKYLTLTKNDQTLCFEEEFKNLGACEIPYHWGFHPNIGKPFLNENCVFELPFAGRQIAMPKEGSMENSLTFFENVKTSYARVLNQKTGVGLELTWDSRLIQNCWLWISAGQNRGHHHFDGTYVACILPTSAENLEGLERAYRAGTALILPADGVQKNQYCIGVVRK